MGFDFKRYLIFILGIYVVQIVLQNILYSMGVDPILILVIVDLVAAFLIVYFNTPSIYRREAIRTPRFHMHVVGLFLIFLLFTIIF